MRKGFSNFKWAFSGESESMVTSGGLVEWRGPTALAPMGDGLDWEDLNGAWLLPGFIDSHCHILPTGLDLQKLHLGECQTKDDVIDAVSERHTQLPEAEWLHAVHYDQTKFPDGTHLSLHDLDPISVDRPILLRHVNGHASVANSAALRAAKIDPKVEDPRGGAYVRDESGELTGVLLERAHEFVTSNAPAPTLDQMIDAILKAGDEMAEVGITCASDMMTGRWDLPMELEAYRIASESGCKIRLRLYAQWSAVFGARGLTAKGLRDRTLTMDPAKCKLAGIKIFADGAIGSATAATYGTFPDGGHGTLIYEPDKLKEMVRTAHENGFQIAIHSIGDRSTDLVMDAYSALANATRHRIEHAMILSDSQIARMADLGCHCAMQPEFLTRFAHAYQRQLGPKRASMLKRFRSVMESGIRLSFSSDRPIVAGDPWDGILNAEMRPEGFNPSENISRDSAIRNTIEMGALANEDEGMASLTQGTWADFQLYEDDPLHAARPRLIRTSSEGPSASN